ncbi:unnamed protein product [Pleuronectes platessa]|uniref:Rhodanese domain-containing protein n=1 Tax=Pleuronectes platessa TaxID=8262 RepID=A0A9N7UGG6_PLEPL|nr:unnamed protein product [Pleuronectes platessa]
MEGQLTVYNYRGGPCYRCLYPVPPPPETVTNCSDGGVLGVVPGTMGCFAGFRSREDRLWTRLFLRPEAADLEDYESFCGSAATDKCRNLNLLSGNQRITVQDYKSILDNAEPHLLLDVRPLVEVDICHLPFSLNIPLSRLEERESGHMQLFQERLSQLKQQTAGDRRPPVYVICKLGNDSQKAVQLLEEMSGSEVDSITLKDIRGGLTSWSKKIDPTFPQY